MSSIPNRIDFLEYGLRELIRKSNPSLLLEKEEDVTLIHRENVRNPSILS